MKDERVLAMYDVRGKQEYIYRSRKIQEIIGASCVIRDVFEDYLYPAARQVRNKEKDMGDKEAVYRYEPKTVEAFSIKAFEQRMQEGDYIGEVVYDGGGNFLVLYRDRETCIRVNRLFTKSLMEYTGTLKVLCTILEHPDFMQYREDNRKLYERHRRNEATESVIHPVNNLPVIQVDPRTSRPLSVKRIVAGADGDGRKKMSLENAAKYDKYRKEEKSGEAAEEKILDRIVEKKGEESLLAVIYIDGNNMGAQVQKCLDGKESYEECVTELRRFSGEIQKNYVDDRMDAINTMLDEKYKVEGKVLSTVDFKSAEANLGYKDENDQEKKDKPGKKRRTIVAAGDEMAVICNARDALDVVKAYFKDFPEECSSCVGIAVFHSHAPYADAYRLAEECCENGKAWMKKKAVNHACLLDFHYCQGGIGISLEEIRKKELPEKDCSRPWMILSHSKDKADGFCYSLELAEEMAVLLQRLGRSNVKSLLSAALNSPADLEMELERINAHRTEPEDFTLGGKLNEEQKRKLIYDIVLVYDLWFRKDEV